MTILKKINIAYCFIGILLYAIFFPVTYNVNNLIYWTSLLMFIIFGILVISSYKQKSVFFTKKNLAATVFCCALFEVLIYNMLSYQIDGDTFVFSKVDAILYYHNSMKMSDMDSISGFKYLAQMMGFDDWGAFLWISMIFRVIQSKVFLDISHCFVGTLSALMLFNIGRYLMPRRYAYMAALTFSIASFTTLYHALCLKETILIFLIIASFYFFYLFLRLKRSWYIILVLLCSSLVLLLRTPISILLILSFGLTLIFMYSKGIFVVILSVFFSLAVYSSSFFAITYERYLRGGNTDLIVERKIELSRGGGINYVVDPLSALIGPFPSISVGIKKLSSLYASGLIYRVLLSVPFFLGVYYTFRYKQKKMYPLILFFLINAIGVAVSVKGLELRLTLPHLAMMYLVAFWWLANYDYRRIKKEVSNLSFTIYVSLTMVLFLIWNMRDKV